MSFHFCSCQHHHVRLTCRRAVSGRPGVTAPSGYVDDDALTLFNCPHPRQIPILLFSIALPSSWLPSQSSFTTACGVFCVRFLPVRLFPCLQYHLFFTVIRLPFFRALHQSFLCDVGMLPIIPVALRAFAACSASSSSS